MSRSQEELNKRDQEKKEQIALEKLGKFETSVASSYSCRCNSSCSCSFEENWSNI